MDSYFGIVIIVVSFLFAIIFPKIIAIGTKGIVLELVTIFTGLLFGPEFLNIIDHRFLTEIDPLFLAALAWVGILVGEQFNLDMLKKFNSQFYTFSVIESFFPFLFVLISLSILSFYVNLPINNMAVLLLLASISMVTSIFHIYLNSKNEGAISNYFKFSSSVLILVAIVLFQLFMFLDHPINTLFERIFSPFEWFVIVTLVAVLMGMLFIFSSRIKLQQAELSVLNLGFVLLIGGVSNILFVTPLFIGLVVGILLTNFSNKNEIFYKILQKGEKPAFLMILFLSGILWSPGKDARFYLLAGFVYVVARFLGKIVSIVIFRKYVIKEKNENTLLLSSLLLPQGSVVLMLVVNYHMIYMNRSSNFLLSIVIISYIVNYIAGDFIASGKIITDD